MWSWKWYTIGVVIVWMVTSLMTVWGGLLVNNVGTVGLAFVTPYLFRLLVMRFKQTHRRVLALGALYFLVMSGTIFVLRGSHSVVILIVAAFTIGIIAGIVHGRTMRVSPR